MSLLELGKTQVELNPGQLGVKSEGLFVGAWAAAVYFSSFESTTPSLAKAAASRGWLSVTARHAFAASANLPCCSRTTASFED
jgi:hypothetical protein